MASIHPRTNKSGKVWQVRWRVDGKPRTRIAHSMAEARRVKLAVELHGDYVATGEDAHGVPTVREQAEAFLASHTRGNAATVREYRRIIDQHITPAFGDVIVTAVSAPLLSTWARGLLMSDKTRANVTAVMSGILESAVPEWLPANPWRKVRLAKSTTVKARHFLTPAHIRMILAELPEHYRPLVITLSMSGLRWGEAAAMTVGDLDLSSGEPVFTVTKAVKHRAKQGDEPGTPKTERGTRVAAAPGALVPVLLPLVQRPKAEPLFATVTGKRLRNSTFHTLVWQPAVKAAEAKGLPFRPRIHDLRAFATTWMIETGMRPDEVADLMGHEDVKTTLNIYRRANPAARSRAAKAMSSVLAEILGTTPEIEAHDNRSPR